MSAFHPGRLLRCAGLLIVLWCAGAVLGALPSDPAGGGHQRLSLAPSAYAQGAACRAGSDFENNTVQGWTTSNVDTSGSPPVSRIRPGGPTGSAFYYHLKDASGASTLNAPAPFLGNLVAGLTPGCRRELCFDVNLFNDGDNDATLHPGFAASFTIYGSATSAAPRVTFTSAPQQITETGGSNPGWHRFCAPLQTLQTGDPLPAGWTNLVDATGNPSSSAADWNALMNATAAMRFPVDWGSSFQTEEVGYDNFCIRDICECVTFAQTKVECATGPSGPSGCYTVTTVVTNNTGQAASYVLVAGSTASPNVIPLSPPLPSGQSRPITFTLCPPANSTVAAVDISLSGPGGEPCCRQTLRFDLPPCPRPECLWVPKYSTGCIAGAPPGTFNLWFNYRNMTNCPTSLFLIASPPSTATASYFAGPYMPFTGPGPTYNVPVKITGATSSTFCMIISQQCKDKGNCCSRKVCFTVPNCWASPLPMPTAEPLPLATGAGAEGGQ